MTVPWKVATQRADYVDEEILAYAEANQDSKRRSDPSAASESVNFETAVRCSASPNHDEDVEEMMRLRLRSGRA